MKQWMPEDQGWVDKGPRVLRTLDSDWAVGRLPATWPREDKAAREVWRQGRDNPRFLSRVEDRLARHNRAVRRGDQEAMEAWYETQVKTRVRKKR